jgi:UDP-N-acetylglucosamine 2-epimerase
VRLVSVVGTRPQLIKAAALLPAIRARHDEVFVDTGQHWDEAMATSFFGELGLPRPDHSLGIGGGSHGDQTGRMLAALGPILAAERPDAVVVYGDTNSTLAGALAAAKLGLPVAHVEAGLRSFDRTMPEEVNRVVADRLSTWLFAPTATAVANLAAEGLTDGVALVGDVLQDLAARTAAEVADPAVLVGIEAALRADPGGDGAGPAAPLRLRPGAYLLATIHRAANRDAAALAAWAELLGAVARPERPVVLPLHPGTRAALATAGVTLAPDVHAVPPVGYRASLALQLHAAAVLTDSGGVQREAAWLGVPCLVLRDVTEWVEAVEASDGLMVVVGLDAERARSELARLAPPDLAPRIAEDRAAWLDLEPSGAAEAISQALATAGAGMSDVVGSERAGR